MVRELARQSMSAAKEARTKLIFPYLYKSGGRQFHRFSEATDFSTR